MGRRLVTRPAILGPCPQRPYGIDCQLQLAQGWFFGGYDAARPASKQARIEVNQEREDALDWLIDSDRRAGYEYRFLT